MLDHRLYRAAFAPLVLAVIVAAFALSDRPRPIGTTLAPDAFDGARAAATLGELARTFPNRRPGSPGDDALARRVEEELDRAGFAPRRTTARAATVDGDATLTTIVGERTGRNGRRLLIVAQRDAVSSDAAAELSGTAALIELARLFRGRTVRRTLTFASVSGAGGAAGVRDLVGRLTGPTDAAIVLGDIASTDVRPPVVVPWSEKGGTAPVRLRRTVESAVREEAEIDPAFPRALTQLVRLAVPLSLTPQGALGAEGFSAVTVQASGERGPQPGARTSPERLEGFGRATLRSISALDNGPDVPAGPREYVIFQRRVLALWAVAMLAGLLLLPALVAAVDGLARVRRRRRPVAIWLRWLAAGALPFLLVALLARVFGLTGLVPALEGAVDPRAVPVVWAAVAGAAFAFLLGLVARPALSRALGIHDVPTGEGPAAALAVLVCALTLVVLVVNPYTALLLVPAAHLWMLAAAPEGRLRRLPGVLAVLAGLLPLALVALHYASQFGLGPGEVGWGSLLLMAGGTTGPLGVLLWSLLLGCGLAAAILTWRKPPPTASPSPSCRP
jgi:hypothetical protein